MLTAFRWAAECYTDPAMARLFEAAIPRDTYGEYQWAHERGAQLT